MKKANAKKQKVVVNKRGHSRGMLSGIFNACCYKTKGNALLNGYVEDPRLHPSGMTPYEWPSGMTR